MGHAARQRDAWPAVALRAWGPDAAEVRTLMGLIASSSFVTDSLLVELMEDDTVPLRYKELQQELLMEVENVESLGMPVFTMVDDACGMSARTLRHQAKCSALTQAAFSSERIRPAFADTGLGALGSRAMFLRGLRGDALPQDLDAEAQLQAYIVKNSRLPSMRRLAHLRARPCRMA